MNKKWKPILTKEQRWAIESMAQQIQFAEEAREILVRRDYGEKFDPKKLKRLATRLATILMSIGNTWEFARSDLTGEELQLEPFSLRGKPPSRWMVPKPKTKRTRIQNKRPKETI